VRETFISRKSSFKYMPLVDSQLVLLPVLLIKLGLLRSSVEALDENRDGLS
jgi:hypothetical protein